MSVKTKKAFVHPSAIVHPEAELGSEVTVGPYSVIEAGVQIGDGTKIGARATIEGNTTIGQENEIFTGAVVGSVTQDKKYDGGKSFLRIGDRNKIREYVTINPGTGEGTETIIGNDNLIMAYAHVAHDCIIGDHVIIANAGTLAGHVIIDDYAIVGGLCGVHQFVRIGYLAIIGGNSKVVQDIPPFMMGDGHPVRAYGINSVGLERAGVAKEERMAIKRAFKVIFKSGNSTKSAIEQLQDEGEKHAGVKRIITFLEKTDRGICK
jgi:UDP-N-acetylglucosamine acyltransferase